MLTGSTSRSVELMFVHIPQGTALLLSLRFLLRLPPVVTSKPELLVLPVHVASTMQAPRRAVACSGAADLAGPYGCKRHAHMWGGPGLRTSLPPACHAGNVKRPRYAAMPATAEGHVEPEADGRTLQPAHTSAKHAC
jgi:hypothetical protein